MIPSTTVVIRELRLQYNSSSVKYTFCNKLLMAYLKRQMSKDNFVSLLVVKICNFYTNLMWRPAIFFTHSYLFFVQCLDSTGVTTSPLSTSSNNIFKVKKHW